MTKQPPPAQATDLKHLKPRGDRYEWYSSQFAGPAVRVEVDYDLGGPNFFTGGTRGRGVYVTVTPVTLKDGMVSTLAFSGLTALVLPLKARSAKRVLEVARTLDPHVPDLARAWAPDPAKDAETHSWNKQDAQARVAALLRELFPSGA